MLIGKWQIPLNSNYDEAPQIMAEQELNLGDYQALRDKMINHSG